MLVAIVAQVIQWLLSKGFIAAEHALVLWLERHRSQKALDANQKKLQDAFHAGDKDEIKKAGENALNNVQPPKP